MRSKFQEEFASVFDEFRDRGSEENGFPHVLPPVSGVEFLAREFLAGHGRDVGYRTRLRLDVREHFEEFLADGIHLMRVECVVDAQPSDKGAAV